ncbi:MAG: replication restart helicase PriA [Acholeplasmatales bacterium]
MYVSVLLDIASKKLNKTFAYKVPSYIKNIDLGMRVVVDFNNRRQLAYVVGKMSASKEATKEVLYVVDKKPILTKSQLEIVNFIKEKAHTNYKVAFDTVIASALKTTKIKAYKVLKEELIPKELQPLIKNGFILEKDIKKTRNKTINQLIYDGVISLGETITRKMNPLYTKELFVKPFNRKLTSRQEEIVRRINKPVLIDSLLEEGYSKDIIERLISYDVVGYKEVLSLREYIQEYKENVELPTLRLEQINAINEVKDNYKRYLLFGPPGSGKTEVYLNLIKKVLDSNKQALVLVPEISLIPLTASRLFNRFKEEIAVFHSGLTPREKYDTYIKVKEKKAKIILGVRSATFLPFDKLGIIIMDEAHDLSYIQKTHPFYDAKEICELLGKYYHAPVLYLSATPSVDMMYESEMGMIKKLELKHHTSNTKTLIIDMKEELIKGNITIFSSKFKEALTKTINSGKQAIILVNRRGYAPFMLCRNCGDVRKCPNCEVSLVYHKNKNVLKCHHCGYEEAHINLCRVCKSEKIKQVGFGVELVCEELEKEFKDIKVLRLDQDILESNTHDAILTAFKNGEANVLLGTQMVSKGHHFTNVNLVMVMLADQMLKLNSYLANEKTYNLITQHVGRIRESGGLAIIQAYDTNHFVLDSIKNNSYMEYYNKELNYRKLGKYLPYYNVVKLTLKGEDELKVIKELNKIKNRILAKNSQFIILGPIDDFILYKDKLYNYSITIKTPRHIKINSLLEYLDKKYYNSYYLNIDYYPDLL